MMAAVLLFVILFAGPATAGETLPAFVTPPRAVVQASTQLSAMLADQFGPESFRRYYRLARASHPRGVDAFFVFYSFDGWGGFADCCFRQYVAWFERVKPFPGDMVQHEKIVLMGAARVGPNADVDSAHTVGSSVLLPYRYWGPDDGPSNPTKHGVLEIRIDHDVLVVEARPNDAR